MRDDAIRKFERCRRIRLRREVLPPFFAKEEESVYL